MAGATSKTVTVKSGQTLSSIAKANNTTVNAILAANPKFTTQDKFQNGNMIWAGTTVKIPAATTTSTKPSTTTSTPPPTQTTIVSPPAVSTPSITISAPEPVSPAPPAPPAITMGYSSEAIKIATSNLIVDAVPPTSIEEMADLIFEEIGGRELISISRNDIVNGQEVTYQPIKNLSLLDQRYNSKTIIYLQSNAEEYFNNFSIYADLYSSIPIDGIVSNSAYVDPETGDLVIILSDMLTDYNVEVQIFNSGTIVDDTIY